MFMHGALGQEIRGLAYVTAFYQLQPSPRSIILTSALELD